MEKQWRKHTCTGSEIKVNYKYSNTVTSPLLFPKEKKKMLKKKINWMSLSYSSNKGLFFFFLKFDMSFLIDSQSLVTWWWSDNPSTSCYHRRWRWCPLAVCGPDWVVCLWLVCLHWGCVARISADIGTWSGRVEWQMAPLLALGNLSNRGFPGDGDTTGQKSLGRGCRCSRQNV